MSRTEECIIHRPAAPVGSFLLWICGAAVIVIYYQVSLIVLVKVHSHKGKIR